MLDFFYHFVLVPRCVMRMVSFLLFCTRNEGVDRQLRRGYVVDYQKVSGLPCFHFLGESKTKSAFFRVSVL